MILQGQFDPNKINNLDAINFSVSSKTIIFRKTSLSMINQMGSQIKQTLDEFICTNDIHKFTYIINDLSYHILITCQSTIEMKMMFTQKLRT